MAVTEYKCRRCGRALETFMELGKYAAACSNGTCLAAYEYELYDTEKELYEALQSAPKDVV